ncbi:MAG: glycosyl transferase family 1 [Microcystis aeruginosa W13-11]|nr:glycosyl transferase family 1 [Microcystis aeruginosa W13-11]
MARGINWVLEDTERYNQLCIRARQKVEQEFTLEIQASKYLKLYCKVL